MLRTRRLIGNRTYLLKDLTDAKIRPSWFDPALTLQFGRKSVAIAGRPPENVLAQLKVLWPQAAPILDQAARQR